MSMCVADTPVEHYPEFGLHVKREDLCCPGGPDFSKTRGVFAHVAARPEDVIGVLDTFHSQGGFAVARACQMLGKQCHVFYPVRKTEASGAVKPQQVAARELGATLWAMSAGRSAILYHRARQELTVRFGSSAYMMPNALKLAESVEETAREVERTALPPVETVLVSASSGTIAAGLILGLHRVAWPGRRVVVHMGYSRPEGAVRSYIIKMAFGAHEANVALWAQKIVVVDEGYSYADETCDGHVLPFPANTYYDAKAADWWVNAGRAQYDKALFWLIG